MEIAAASEVSRRDNLANNQVLLVDDDTIFSEQLKLLCQRLGYEVVSTSTSQEFVQKLNQGDNFSAVIIDQFIGSDLGLDLIPIVRNFDSDIRILVLTGFANYRSAIVAGKQGADEYLTKPLSLAGLKTALEGEATPFLQKHPVTVPLEQVEWEYINRVLSLCAGNVSQTARCLGLHRRTLQRKLARKRDDA